jgi:hypothetical protein
MFSKLNHQPNKTPDHVKFLEDIKDFDLEFQKSQIKDQKDSEMEEEEEDEGPEIKLRTRTTQYPAGHSLNRCPVSNPPSHILEYAKLLFDILKELHGHHKQIEIVTENKQGRVDIFQEELTKFYGFEFLVKKKSKGCPELFHQEHDQLRQHKFNNHDKVYNAMCDFLHKMHAKETQVFKEWENSKIRPIYGDEKGPLFPDRDPMQIIEDLLNHNKKQKIQASKFKIQFKGSNQMYFTIHHEYILYMCIPSCDGSFRDFFPM